MPIVSSTRRLADEDLLEAALQRRVLLDVLAVLVERGRADHAQLAAGEHRLDHVAGVHRGVAGGAGADDGVQLVDEGDDLALGVGDLLQHGLEPLLELAAVLGAGHHRAEVQRHQALALEALRDVAGDDPLGQALDDRGLADAGLADQHRVVLGAPGQHLDDAADLGVPADDRVDLARRGPAAVRSTAYFSSAWKVPSGSGVVTLRLPRTVRKAASRVSRVAPAPVRTAPASPSEPASPTSRCSVETYSSPRALGLLARGVDHPQQLAGRRGRGHGGAADAGHPAQRGVGLGADVGRVGADRLQQRAGDAVGLLEQGDEQVQRLQRGLAAVDGEPLGGGDGFLRTGGELALHGRWRASSRLGRGRPVRPAAWSTGPTTAELSLFHSTLASSRPAPPS